MKKLIVGSLLVLLALPVLAAKYHKLKKPTNPALAEVYEAADTDKQLYQRAVKIDVPTPAKGRSEEEVRVGTVKQVAHTLCGFFDEGVKLERAENTRAGIAGAIAKLEDSQQFDDENGAKIRSTMIDGLTKAVKAKNSGVEVYYGSAGGNNTMGTVLGVYDTENDEVMAFSFTNCGSDD